MHYMAEYGFFLAKTLTALIAILFLVAGVVAILAKNKGGNHAKLRIEPLNKKFESYADLLNEESLSKKAKKKLAKEKKAIEKKTDEGRQRIFVLDFNGDIRASEVNSFREAITALLTILKSNDEVVVRLESPGGMVHAYGLAASQLDRIRQRGIPLTVSVDKVAASGGYLMACVADKILAAPFAIIGSIGVIAQIPNFHRLLKKNDIDFEQVTAGKFKRTLTLFGENTEEEREKLREELGEVHESFKEYIVHHREGVDISKVATGEHWLAVKAKQLNLVDELITSDDYLLEKSKLSDVFHVSYTEKKPLLARILEKTQYQGQLRGWM